MKRLLKIFSYIFLAFAAVIVLLLATLPLLIPPLASRIADSQGIELSVRQVHIDWVDGQIAISDVSARANDVPDVKPLTLELLRVDIGLDALINERRVQLEAALLENMSVPLTIELGEEQAVASVTIAGINPQSFTASAEPAREPEEEGAEPPFAFDGWEVLRLADIEVDAELIQAGSSKSLPLTLSKLEIGRLSLIETPAPIALDARLELNQTELELLGFIEPLAVEQNGQFDINIENVDLESWASLAQFLQIDLRPLGDVAGKLALTTNLQWRLKEQGVQLLLTDSQLDMKHLSLAVLPDDKAKDKAGITFKTSLRTTFEKLNLQTSPLHYALYGAELNGREFSLDDPGYDPSLSLLLSQVVIKINQLDTQKTEQPSIISLNSNIGRYGKIALNGEGSFLDSKASGKLTLDGEQISLPAFSGLAKKAIGKHIDKGALDFNMTASIKAGQLDSKTKIEAHQISLSGDFGAQSTVVEELGMPINAALNLLRDKDDTVRLTVPVHGNLRDPKVKIGSIVNKAVMKGIQTAVFSQFGPLMALSALDKARTMADGLKLKPIEFNNLQTEIDTMDKSVVERLDNIAKLLNSRPKIKLNVCGFAVGRELQLAPETKESAASPSKKKQRSDVAINEQANTGQALSAEQKKQLTDVASLRAEHAKDQLMQRGVEGKRLILCAPQVAVDENTMPGVEFSL